MKRKFDSSVLVIPALLGAFALASAGCELKSKAEREEEKEVKLEAKEARKEKKQELKEEAAVIRAKKEKIEDRLAATQDAIAAELRAQRYERQARAEALAEERARVRAAQKDRDDRIKAFKAIAGEYKGQYAGADGNAITVLVSLSVAGLPTERQSYRKTGEGDMIQGADALSLGAKILETWGDPRNPDNVQSKCNASGIKPDLATGLIEVVCEKRSYVLGVDTPASAAAAELDVNEFEANSRSLAPGLAQGEISRVGALNLRVQTLFGDFLGTAERARK